MLDAPVPRAYIPKSEFWSLLTKREQKLLAIISDETPTSVRNLRGVLDCYKHLLHGRGQTKVCVFLLLLCRIGLNMYTVGSTASIVWQSWDGQLSFGSDTTHVTMKEHVLQICHRAPEALGNTGENNTTNEAFGGCISTDDSRLRVFRVIAGAEGLFAVLMILAFLWVVVQFLLCSPVTHCPHGFSRRAIFASRRPFLFILLPRYASGFSFIKLLQYATVGDAYEMIVDQRNMVVFKVLLASICPSCFMTRLAKYHGNLLGSIVGYFFRLFAFLTMVYLGSSALFIKLTIVHFACFTGPFHWDTYEWLQVLGFINQIVAIFDTDWVEVSRLLKFSLGGTEGRWDEPRHGEDVWELVYAYAQLCTKEISKEK